MKIEQRDIDEIRPYETNPRRNDKAVEAVAKSIRALGFRQPIVVDDQGVIVVGHTRWKAAKKLGFKKVPVHVAKDLTPEQARAYPLADNRTAERAEWDVELLPVELGQLAVRAVHLGEPADPLSADVHRRREDAQGGPARTEAGRHALAGGAAMQDVNDTTDQKTDYGLQCRACGCRHFRVIYTRRTWGNRIMRRRECRHCGMLLAPGGSSTCVCSFSYKTSLALIPVERHERWGIYLTGPELGQGTGSAWKGAEKIVGRPAGFSVLRLNLNAPGDHYDKTGGGNFLAWPQATRSGKGFIVVPVKGTDDAAGFRLNSDFTPIAGTARPWIYASGLTGELKLGILGTQRKKYSVRLHFMEPEPLQEGGRVLDVKINGKIVLAQFDIAAGAGAPRKAVVKEVEGIGPCTTIELTLRRVSGKPPLLCGIEVIPP